MTIILLLCGYGLSAQASAQSYTDIQFDRIEGTAVQFKSAAEGSTPPKPLETGLNEPEYLQLIQPTEGGIPYILMAGRTCKECGDEKGLFLIRVDGARKSQFVYPGKVRDAETNQLLLDSRAFYGKCLPGDGDGLIIYQAEKIDRRRFLQSSVFIAEPQPDSIREQLIERRLPKIKRTLDQVKRKLCSEVPGWNRQMHKSSFSIKPKDAPATGG